MLNIQDFFASIDNKSIINNLSLTVQKGEVHAIMGPNGAGKSTLAKVLAGDPSFEVKGEILFNGQDISQLDPEERAHLGLFMSFQHPVEIPGISNVQFLFAAVNAKLKANQKDEISEDQFNVALDEKMKAMHVKEEFKHRSINEGFSGGEKKRNEILQMLMLDPCLAILDETDSGLDIDAMKIVASGVNQMRSADKSLILITHYPRLLEYVKPDIVHVMMEGKIVHSGDFSLAQELEKKGYDLLLNKGC